MKSYSNLLKVCAGNIEKEEKYFQKMINFNIKPCQLTFNLLIP